MNEIREYLDRAIAEGRIDLAFDRADEARAWRWRLYNYRRGRPEYDQLMFACDGNVVSIIRPQPREVNQSTD